ncbi:MAG TPA: hypothetical protein VF785_03335 [Gemmatimonadaceae bacterium]
MLTIRRAVLGLIVVPAIVFAQRGGGGGAGGGRVRGDPNADWKSIMGSGEGLKLSNRDVENIDPLKLLMDKRKDLKLSDDQSNRLKELDGKLKEKNQDSFRALDSLRRLAQPPAHDPTDDDRARMTAARRAAAFTVGTIRENYAAALKEALPVLDETQQKMAGDLVEKQNADAEAMLRDKLGGRG